jgi:hypothetical protein
MWWAQRPRVALGGWLQDSTQSADIRQVHAHLQRLSKHEPAVHDAAVQLLQSGESLPDLLFRSNSPAVNPAILCMMHACTTALCKGSQQVKVTQSAGKSSAAAVTNRPHVGEVWWLFDQGRPYLAEVFENGAVPDSRLPHLQRSTIKGRHVARPLGEQRPAIKLIAHRAKMCMYTSKCANNPIFCSTQCFIYADTVERLDLRTVTLMFNELAVLSKLLRHIHIIPKMVFILFQVQKLIQAYICLLS